MILGCILTLIGQLIHTAAAIKARRQSHACGGARNWHLVGGWIQFIACKIFLMISLSLKNKKEKQVLNNNNKKNTKVLTIQLPVVATEVMFCMDIKENLKKQLKT